MKQKIKQRTTTKIPQLKRSENFVQLLVEGKPFIILGGETHNSSTSSPRYMEEKVWERVLALHCNTVLTPVSWELVEPREGRFDFRLVDSLIKTARKRKLRLVLLWFGAWKNTRSNYAPSWVKQDLKRFERAQVIPGKNSDTISCLSESACTVESRAFAALMRHLHRFDGARHTVLMIQVENEVGLSGTARDHSPLAESCFRESVPTKLMAYLQSHRNVLDPTLRETWETSGDRSSGTWTEVFGRGADEIFMAWHIARYVDRVAQAGRSAYPLPMYVNAWLRQHAGQSPGAYPSGGPVAPVMDIWRCAAPSLILAPDMDEQNDFAAVCAEYTRGGHPLVIPEARRDERAAAHVFYAVGQHHALCFSPFGIEDVGADSLLADSYHILANMMPILTRYYGTDRMVGVLQTDRQPVFTQEEQHPMEWRTIELGNYRLNIHFTAPCGTGCTPGAGLIIALSNDEYLIAGHGFSVTFLSRPGGLQIADYLALDEGTYVRGQWVQGRRLNGDELKVELGNRPCVRRVRLYSYA